MCDRIGQRGRENEDNLAVILSPHMLKGLAGFLSKFHKKFPPLSTFRRSHCAG